MAKLDHRLFRIPPLVRIPNCLLVQQIVADLTLDKQMLQDVLKKSSKEQAALTAGEQPVGGLPRIGTKGLCGSDAFASSVSLPRASPR